MSRMCMYVLIIFRKQKKENILKSKNKGSPTCNDLKTYFTSDFTKIISSLNESW